MVLNDYMLFLPWLGSKLLRASLWSRFVLVFYLDHQHQAANLAALLQLSGDWT